MKVRYIGDWDTLALVYGKVYEVISVEHGWYRIMTELDEDYLFPPKLFEIVEDLKMLDYESDHFCPVYNKVIDIDLCYDSLCCLKGLFKVSSTPELSEISDIEEARRVCSICQYSDFGGGIKE